MSKRTIYNLYGDKERLFRAILSESLDTAERYAEEVTSGFGDADDVEMALRAAGLRLAQAIFGGRVVPLRRLLVGEVTRFPDLAGEYYQRAPQRVIVSIAEALARFDERGALRMDDPVIAAEHSSSARRWIVPCSPPRSVRRRRARSRLARGLASTPSFALTRHPGDPVGGLRPKMTARRQSSRARWHLRANAPVLGWLLVALVVAVAHPLVPYSRWLLVHLVHLVPLGGVSNAIVVWSAHFATALLRSTRGNSYRSQAARLGALNLGVVLVVAGMLLAGWPVVVLGAALVAGAALWNGASLVRQISQATSTDFTVVVRFHVAAVACLFVGLALGTLLAGGFVETLTERLLVAHVIVNVLGWVGLTIIGTLTILWPTMLRTRRAPRAGQSPPPALIVLVSAVAAASGSALVGWQELAAVGVLAYLVGLFIVSRPLVVAARQRLPSSYPTWSVLAGCAWLAGSLVALAWMLVSALSWNDVVVGLRSLVFPLAVGFTVQVLLGALSYLVPVVLGGGAGPVTRASRRLNAAGGLRICVINAGLLIVVLPVPSTVQTIMATAVLLALGAFLPLLAAAIWTSRRGRTAGDTGRRGTGA